MTEEQKYGETWVYESLVGAIPGLSFSDATAVGIQFLLFELCAVLFAVVYGLRYALLAGTVAIAVAAVGSAVMLVLGRRIRKLETPPAYRRLLFSSQIEVVLGLFAFVALLVYLFVYDPRNGETLLLARLLGDRPPVLPSYLLLLVLWDVCYRIGISWWASVVNIWLALGHSDALSVSAREEFVRIDLTAICYALLQLVMVPFVSSHPVLVAAIVGHVVAVLLVAGSSALLFARS